MVFTHRNTKVFLTFVFACGAIYMMDMKEMKFMDGALSNYNNPIQMQSKHGNSSNALEVGNDKTSQKGEEIKTDHPTQESTSMPSSKPSAKASEPMTNPPSHRKTESPSSKPSSPPTTNNDADGAKEIDMSGVTCPVAEEDSSSSYPPGFPQILRAGNYTSESSHPYLSKDIWAELVDNKRTFFLRPYEDGFPNRTTLREWIASRPHPITLVMNNYMDLCFPPQKNGVRNKLIPEEEEMLMVNEIIDMMNETNLHALYIENLQSTSNYGISVEHPKLKPLPRGHKWQFRNSWLYGESKETQKNLYASVSTSPQETKALFKQNRTSTIWVKPNYETNHEGVIKYYRNVNPATRKNNRFACKELERATMNLTKICTDGPAMNQTQSFDELKKHRFVMSPTGISLDSHFTWDALLAGCIPIVPRSSLEPIFEDLPVWTVDAWDSITDEDVEAKAIEMTAKADTYNWEKLFANWWKKEIHQGLCEISADNDGATVKSSNSTVFDPLLVPKIESKVVEQKPIEAGKHYKVPPPEERIGPDGKGGYIHDPSFMRKSPRALHYVDKSIGCLLPGDGFESLEGYYGLLKVREYLKKRRHTSPLETGTRDTKEGDDNGGQRRPTLMCAVYTYEGGTNRTNAIWETWGGRCDGFLIASSITNLTTGHMHMPNSAAHQHDYDGIYQKVRAMLAYLYDNFLDDYDFFHILGDDVYLVVDNLKDFLASPEVQNFESRHPGNLILAGDWLCWGDDLKHLNYDYYMGGGSGYTMSRKALKAFAEGPLQDEWHGNLLRESGEDYRVSQLFREYFNVRGMDTRDEYGAKRYHQVSGFDAAVYPDESRGFRFKIYRESLESMEFRRGFPILYKEDLVSSSSIAFHRLEHDAIRRYEMILYGTGVEQCGENRTGLQP